MNRVITGKKKNRGVYRIFRIGAPIYGSKKKKFKKAIWYDLFEYSNHPAWFFKQLDTYWLCQMSLFYVSKTMQLKNRVYIDFMCRRQILCIRAGRNVTSKSNNFLGNEFNGTIVYFYWKFLCDNKFSCEMKSVITAS